MRRNHRDGPVTARASSVRSAASALDRPNADWVSPTALRTNPRNARTHSHKQLRKIADSISKFGFTNPILIDDSNMVLAGHGRLEAAKQLGLERVPIIRIGYLSEAQKRAYVVADNRIAELAGWDRETLTVELGELADLLLQEGLDVSLTGFEAPEIDLLLAAVEGPESEPEAAPPDLPVVATARQKDLWQLGNHHILCDDSRNYRAVSRLMKGTLAAAVFCDPPYNVRVKDIGGRGQTRHSEFAFASGEMSSLQYQQYLTVTLRNGARVSKAGAVHYVCMDWRHVGDLIEVGQKIYDTMLNLVVWAKSNAGQGSFYRSQHELIGVFRVGDQGHRNNIELGRFGRNRSNVWTYAGVNSFAKGRLEALAAHPTVKPVALVADALLDCTRRGDAVLDHFLGSGTTILAAEKTGRVGFGLEFEPKYVDVAITRWQDFTKRDAILIGDGRTFEEVRAARALVEDGDRV